jgi:translation initiation factor IF-2
LDLPACRRLEIAFKQQLLNKRQRKLQNKRQQLIREQGLRTHKHITLDEIGRRLAIGNFKELNLVVKGDVDGSVEALSDSLLKLSTQEIQVNVIFKAVGQIFRKRCATSVGF